MNLYFLAPLLALVGLLQTTLVPHVTVLGAKPNLMLLLVAAWTLLNGSQEGLWWALIGGLWLDLLGGSPLGASALALLLAAYVVGASAASIFREQLIVRVLSGLAAGLVYGLALLALLALTGRPTDWLTAFTHVILPDAIFDALLLPVVYLALVGLGQRMGPPRPRVS